MYTDEVVKPSVLIYFSFSVTPVRIFPPETNNFICLEISAKFYKTLRTHDAEGSAQIGLKSYSMNLLSTEKPMTVTRSLKLDPYFLL